MKYINLLELIYPIGSVYFSTEDTSPAQLVGGTWNKIQESQYLMSAGNTYLPSSTGGYNNITLNANQIPKHNHPFYTRVDWAEVQNNKTGSYGGVNGTLITGIWSTTPKTSLCIDMGLERSTNQNSGGGSHSNMPVYYSVYIWVRTG